MKYPQTFTVAVVFAGLTVGYWVGFQNGLHEGLDRNSSQMEVAARQMLEMEKAATRPACQPPD